MRRECEMVSKYNLHMPTIAPIIIHLGDDDDDESEYEDEDHFTEPMPTTWEDSNLPCTATAPSPSPSPSAQQTTVESTGTPNTSTHSSLLLDITGDWVPDSLCAEE